MKKLIAFSLFTALLVSCGGNSDETGSNKETSESEDTTSVDSLLEDTLVVEEDPGRISIDVANLMSKAEQTFELPFSIDSAFVEDLWESETDKGNLTNAEAQYLRFDFVDHESISMSSYDVETFITLDSLKIKGEYEEYQENLDLGMARYSNAKVVGKIHMDDKTTLLIWSTDYATYEACPYGYGTCVFGTVFVDNAGLNSILLGEISGGGDAPYWGSTIVTSEIDASHVYFKKVSESGGDEDPETGEEIIDRSEATETFNISPLGFSIQ